MLWRSADHGVDGKGYEVSGPCVQAPLASTTALYTGVSVEYRTMLLRRALAEHRGDLSGELG
ncbi:hypothetical protein [Streptomyces sp. NBC_00893]|uniref:hypothetical protein n=1 Tax=Streptomyces sp. NBC_00893 TaxID=2975862 RepID=UPI002254F478|nr:hypothetical protein [Streptomyces sp. NBC_00893]MCX4849927.1 hypothetical protein [Streptomyces sp. NBC_00893]